MLKILSLFLFLIPALANNGQQVSVLLDAGVSTLSVTNTGSVGGTIGMSVSPGSFVRLGVTFTTIPVPPVAGTTYTPCMNPCTASINRQWGQQYYFVERLDSGGSPFSPRQISTAGFAYNTNACGSAGTLPMVEPAITTTSPLPMPREVIGQDCFVDRVSIPLQSGHGTSARLFFRADSLTYDTVLLPGRIDGKAEVQINGGAWQIINEANANLAAVDEERFHVWDDTGALKKMGGLGKVRDYILSGITISGGDTAVEIAWRFRGTNGVTSGFRILEMVLLESTDKTLTNINKSGSTAVASSTAHGFTSSDDVLVRGAPGVRCVFNGMRDIASATTDTFTFPASDYSSGGSKLSACVLADGDWAPPINRDPNTNFITAQAVMYASKMMVARSSFTYVDPTSWTAPVGGNATRGLCLIQYGNSTCTPGQINQLWNSNLPYLDNILKNAKCGSCHSPTLADVKYFNYSNGSIIARTIFHALTDQDALDIAAAVRGNAIAVPTQARPWNAPMQTGAGMASGTYTKAATTLTSVVVSSNVGTFTVPGGHGYTTGQPVTTSGATVDTDLNATCTITVTSSTAFTCPTVSVANGTYTESTLQITMGNDFMAGVGIDAGVTTYGYKDMLSSFSDTSKWIYTSNVEPRTITWPYQFVTWNQWLPAIYPGDVYSSADYQGSLPHTKYLSLLSSVTAGNFASYKSNNYTLFDGPKPSSQGPGTEVNQSLFRAAQIWMGNDTIEPNNLFSQAYPTSSQPVTAGAVYPSQWNLFRQGVIQTAMVNMWTLQVEYKLIGLYGQMMADLYGAPTATGCNPPWGWPGKQFFYVGYHVMKMSPGTVGAGYESDWENQSNRWYDGSVAIGAGTCYDVAQTQIDSSYLEKFHNFDGLRRPNGYITTVMDAILSPQAGRNNAVYDFYNATREGLDWGGTLRRSMFTYQKALSYWWFTLAEWTTLVDNHLGTLVLGTINGQDATHWRNIIDNLAAAVPFPSTTDCSIAGGSTTAQAAYLVFLPGGTVNPCNVAASNLTYWTLFGANSTNITTAKNWAATLYPDHNFNLDIAAATEGDTGDYGTGNLSVAGAGKTITYATACPVTANFSDSGGMPLMIGGGTGRSEAIFSATGTCVKGAPGTLVVQTVQTHTGSWKATLGCSTANPVPNYNVGQSDEWWRCRNMFQ